MNNPNKTMDNSKKRILSRNAKKNIFLAGLFFIPVVHFIIFWGVVNFNSVILAFQRLNVTTGSKYFTFENFRTVGILFKLGELKDALLNTLLVSGFLMLFLLPWAFLITYFLCKKIPLTGFWRVMLFIPTIIPAIAMAFIFRYIIYPEGPVGHLWALFGKTAPAFLEEPAFARWTVIAYIFWTNFGGQFILLSGAMSRVPKEVLESARIDGAGMRVEMLRIMLPLCWPTISMLILLNMASLFTASGPLLFLNSGGARSETISFWIFKNVNAGAFSIRLNEPAALGIACTVILFPIIMLTRWGLGKVYADVEF